MDSCFPPLAALSLRDGDRKTPPLGPPGVKLNNCGKIEILQDLDLYYIRQIAHNLKVSVDGCNVEGVCVSSHLTSSEPVVI